MPASVIVALDFESRRDALALVAALGEAAASYKVGLQLLTHEGPTIVRELVAMGKEVLVTVHACAGSAVLAAAVRAAAPFPLLKVLALTVITSLNDADLPEIGLAPSVRDQVERLARLAANAGCHGVVASVHEANFLCATLPQGMLIVTPGIQLQAAMADDQARVATPSAAAAAGATHIVIGRAIAHAADPAAAYMAACEAFSRGESRNGDTP
jgi:orotidine-5'-phosphate decarboxylase